ncbi:uncharacterized protein LOC126319955 [Schistocerca gregaria]|uniref:uncharacterized protein LOC126319955 n=1 Tax=Schistocerca gregaria TaxID=7010 RepID=UPI00211DEFE1|nr:uncharacterized protein LOC126319955 [Schistocerca gregaria]
MSSSKQKESDKDHGTNTPSNVIRKPNKRKSLLSLGSSIVSIWSNMKTGTDVLRNGVSLPIELYEPMTILQRTAEMFAYANLLTKAARQTDPIERLIYSTAYCVSGFVGTQRLFSNLNPMLGETFEYIDPEEGYRVLTEQVCHHPPVTALHADSSSWSVYSNCRVVTKFLGNSLDLRPCGRTYILFPECNELLFYSSPQVRIHNLVFGSMWLEHYGELKLTNLKTKASSVIKFKKSGVFSGLHYDVQGKLFDEKGNVLATFEGLWNQKLTVTRNKKSEKSEPEVIWNVDPSFFLPDSQYNFTEFAQKLIEFNSIHNPQILPPSDSRLRPDRLALQKGEVEQANLSKRFLEEQQRRFEKQRKDDNVEWEPSYFRNYDNGVIPETMYLYDGNYWEQREEKEKKIKEGEDPGDLLLPDHIKNQQADFVSLAKEYENLSAQK